MNMLDLMNKMTQLSEAKEKTKTGLKHTAEPGGYGRKDDEDDEGNKVKSTAAKKGKGRPKKDADDAGETKKYDFSAFGVKSGKDVKLPKHDKKKTTVVKGKSQSHADNKKDDGTDPDTKTKKKGLKEYFDSLDKALNENEMSPDAIAKMNPQHKEYFGKNPHFTRGAEVKSVGKTINAKGNPISALATKVTPKFNKPGQVQRISKGSFNSPVEEAEQIQIKPANQMPKQPGQMSPPGQQPQQVSGQPQQNTQVIAQGNKTLGTVNNPQLAQQIKQSIGKGEMTLMPDQQVNELDAGTVASYQDKAFDKFMGGDDKRAHGLTRAYKKQVGAFGHVPTTQKVNEKDIGKHNNATTGFDALVRKLTPKYGAEVAKRIAGAQLKKIREADQPPNDSLMSPMSEARAKADDKAEKAGKKVAKDIEYDEGHKGKDDNKAEKAGKKVTKDIEYDEKHKKTVKEAAKPDFLDIDKDGDKKEPMKKAATDKKKVKEGMEHKLKAARHTGKAHALSKQGYNCGYDDMEESRHYHEGYKEGLDECYGQMPIQGYVGETTPVVSTMASYGAEEGQLAEAGGAAAVYSPEMQARIKTATPQQLSQMANELAGDPSHYKNEYRNLEAAQSELRGTTKYESAIEESPFSWAAKNTPKGDKFSLGGKEFVKNDAFAFEALEKQLNALLEDSEVTEGMTVSISKGQQGAPDSVSVSAQDAEADELLSVIKSAGLGLFGGDDAGQPQGAQPMTVDGGEGPQANIEVVDDHDDMLSLIRKMTGQGPAQANGDYEEEGGHEGHGHEEETCESCGGMMEEGHSCGEAVEEDESMDQREYEVAEDQSGGDDSEESDEVNSDATRDAALATAAGKNFANTDSPIEEATTPDPKYDHEPPAQESDPIPDDSEHDPIPDDQESELEESLANGADDTFESDIDFMTKVISGGLNKQKSTGQTTIPVVSTQVNRLGSPMRESTDLLHDWRKLSGIK